MNKEKETEKIISDKLNSREFAFDEKAWAGMESMLDAQQKKRRFGFWWYFSVSGVFLALIVSIAYYLTIDSKNRNLEVFTKFTGNEVFSEQNDASLQQNEALLEKKEALLQQNEALLQQNNASFEENKAFFVENNTNSKEKSALEEAKEVNKASDEANSAKAAEQTLLSDSASLTETSKNPLTAPGKETKNAWGVVAGVGYWFAYKTTLGATTKDSRLGFTGGIYYQRTLSKRWELGLAAIYSSRGALDFDKTYTNTNFGFGIESDKTTVSPKTLHYFNVPLSIRFNATPRSHFYIGAAYYQLLATTSKVTRTVEDSFGVVESTTEKQTGKHSGFRENDIAAFIGYELTLFDRMNAGLQLNYGFYDITINNYKYEYEGYGDRAYDRNISLQLHLKYDLIRH